MDDPTTRAELTKYLLDATTYYFRKRTFGTIQEMGILPWGKRRIDIIAVKQKGYIVFCEIKSGKPDFLADTKWLDYRPHCNQMYFVFSESDEDWVKEYYPKFREHGIGVLYVSVESNKHRKYIPALSCRGSYYVRSGLGSSVRKLSGKTQKNIITRLAFKASFCFKYGKTNE